jgi:glycosyltransferase involved in cell wall biosynthesis
MYDIVEIWGIYPPPLGGISVYCKRLTDILHGMDSLVTMKNFGRSRSDCAYVKDVRSAFWELFRLPFIKRRIIHVQFRNRLFLSALFFTGWKHKIVITLHNRKMLLQDGWRGRMMRLFLNRVDMVIFNDPSFAELLNTRFGTDLSKMTVLPTFLPPAEAEKRGVTPEIDNFCQKYRYTISSNASILIKNVYGDVYGFDQLIGLMDILVNRNGMDAGMIFLVSEVGDEEFLEEGIRRIESLGLKERFLILVGSDVNGYEVWERTDLFVRATSTDMEGISVKEALFSGTPAIASDVCSRPYEAVLYHCGNIEELAGKSMEILESGKRVVYEPRRDVPLRIMDIYESIRR